MVSLAEISSGSAGTALLLGGATALYVASRAVGDVLLRGRAERPGRAAMALWLPIAGVVLVATVLEEPLLAVEVILSTSVAALSLALGATICAGGFDSRRSLTAGGFGSRGSLTAGDARPLAVGFGRMWAFVLPAGLLVLLIGMSGHVNWLGAIVLLVEGVVLGIAWTGPGAVGDATSTPTLAQSAASRDKSGVTGTQDKTGVGWALIELGLAAGLVVSGAWAATKGAVVFGGGAQVDIRHLVVVLVLSPLLAAPMMMWGSAMSGVGRGAMAMSSLVGVVLLNLCVLLPLAALVWYPVSAGMFRPMTFAWLPEPPVAAVVHGPTWDPDQAPTTMASTTMATTGPTTADANANADANAEPGGSEPSGGGSPSPAAATDAAGIVYPMIAWRIDTILLVVLGVMLLPWGLRGWTPGRLEGTALVLVYLAYAVVQVVMVR